MRRCLTISSMLGCCAESLVTAFPPLPKPLPLPLLSVRLLPGNNRNSGTVKNESMYKQYYHCFSCTVNVSYLASTIFDGKWFSNRLAWIWFNTFLIVTIYLLFIQVHVKCSSKHSDISKRQIQCIWRSTRFSRSLILPNTLQSSQPNLIRLQCYGVTYLSVGLYYWRLSRMTFAPVYGEKRPWQVTWHTLWSGWVGKRV